MHRNDLGIWYIYMQSNKVTIFFAGIDLTQFYVACAFMLFSIYRIGFCLNIYGELQLTINNQLIGCLFTDLPIDVPLWALIDIYGSTQSVQFVLEGDYPSVHSYVTELTKRIV